MGGRTLSGWRAALAIVPVAAHCSGCGSRSGLDGLHVLPATGGAPSADAGTSSTGGTGGVGSSDSGTPGEWTSEGELFGCRVERLEEPANRAIFLWEPCEADPMCEKARFAPDVLTEGLSNYTGSRLMGGDVHDDGNAVRVSLAIWDVFGAPSVWPQTTWVTDDHGRCLDAYRVAKTEEYCLMETSGVWGNRLGVLFSTKEGIPNREAMLLTAVGEPGTFAFVDVYNEFPHYPWVMGAQRWAYGQGLRIASSSNVTGADEHVVATLKGATGGTFQVGDMSGLASAGEHFFFERRMFLPELGAIELFITDGIGPPEHYVTPPADHHDFTAQFADSHVFWLRGKKSDPFDSKFDEIDVWASPFSAQGSALVPEKVGATSLTYQTDFVVAGWGRFALVESNGTIAIWRAKDKQLQVVTPPKDAKAWRLLGLTRDHLWIIVDLDADNAGDYLLRYSLG